MLPIAAVIESHEFHDCKKFVINSLDCGNFISKSFLPEIVNIFQHCHGGVQEISIVNQFYSTTFSPFSSS